MPRQSGLERRHEMSTPQDAIDDLCIDTIRTLSIDGVQKAGSDSLISSTESAVCGMVISPL